MNPRHSHLTQSLDFSKHDGLVPVIVQHTYSGKVLMLGYMNAEALEHTLHSDKVCFFSRSKKRLWVKGESSQHYLYWTDISDDCDHDALLIKALPQGPTCHLGTPSCFHHQDSSNTLLFELENMIQQTRLHLQDHHQNPQHPSTQGYTAALFQAGRDHILQKFGEEAVETLLAASIQSPQRLISESADLIYHFLVMLSQHDIPLAKLMAELHQRRQKKIDNPPSTVTDSHSSS